MNNLYIKFSLLFLSFCLLSGPLLAKDYKIPKNNKRTEIVNTGDFFYDSGKNGDYEYGESGTITFKTTIPGAVIRVTFTEFNVEDAKVKGNGDFKNYYDNLKVYDGGGVSSFSLGVYYGSKGGAYSNKPKTIISSGNQLTFSFTSDTGVEESGWVANIEVVDASEAYCIPSAEYSDSYDYNYIRNVLIGDINNSNTDSDGYKDYTKLFSTNVIIGQAYTLTVSPSYWRDAYECEVWVDWNKDGNFDGMNETIPTSAGSGKYTATIIPPSGASGNTTMRVRIDYYGGGDACSDISYGEVEDYTLNVVAVVDNTPPEISNCPSPITLNTDPGKCNAVVTWIEPTAKDNHTPTKDLIWTKSHVSGDVFPVGTTMVSYSATDASGNTSLNCSFDVTVKVNIVPIKPTLADITEECIATAVAPSITDNCLGTITGTTTDPLIYTTQGTHTITWTFDDGMENGTVLNPFTSLSAARTVSASGRYYFDLGNGKFQADVDNSEGGGWVLILQYHHKRYTNPNLKVIGVGEDLPIADNSSLGTDNSSSSSWGHAGNTALADMLGADEIRWYAKTSAHSRVIHFKSPVGLAYAQTGTGSFNGIESGFTVLTGHTAYVPGNAINEFSNKGDEALTNFPIYRGGNNHWGIRGLGNRWEVDDYPNNSSKSTIHKMWIRGASAPLGNVVTVTQKVIVDDTTPPEVVCQNITAYLDVNGIVTITPEMIDNGSTDNCGVASLKLDKKEFTSIGEKVVKLTVTDINGNSSFCNAVVKVEEMPKLTFSPVPSTIDEGVGVAVIKASLNKISTKEVSFEWCTEDLTAIKGDDYVGVIWNKVKIPAGDLSVDLQVTIIDDDIHEANEEFTVFNKNVVDAISVVDRINWTIIDDDDPLPILSVSDISVDEGVGTAIFKAILNKISSKNVSFRWSTSDWSARQPRDYTRKWWTNITIPAGQLSIDLPVTINDDDEHESDEKFTCYISNVNNAELPKDNAICTIVDNENSASIKVDLKSPQNVFTANQLVQDVLVTGCLTASNVNYSGDEEFGIGYFEAGDSEFPLKSGIILSTGEVLQAVGPNKGGNASNTIGGSSWDSDVFRLAGNTAKDAQILEFDFVPAGDELEFRYIFASEEYPEFVGQGYNDVFGFILSGPDIKDVFRDDGMNIALIPGTNMNVSIDNVNASKNSQFYVNGEDGFATRFDGLTTVLTASAKVTPCQTYHIRLIISDVFDSRINSAVFLEANSFKSNEVRVDNMIGEIAGDLDVMYEGCDGSFMRFTRNENYDINEEINFDIDISGTASNQVDLSPDYYYTYANGKKIGDGSFPSSITIPAGKAYVDYHYKALDDSEIEGDETIIFRIDKCPCDGSEYYEKTVKIINSPKVDGVASAAIQCVGGGNPIATLTVQLASGMDSKNYLYSFDGGLTFDSNNVKSIVGTLPDGSDLVGESFSIVVKDLFSCGDNTLNMTTTIPNISPVTADAGGNRKMCKGVGVQLMGKPGPYCEWSCSSPGIIDFLKGINKSNPWVADDIPVGSYEFTLRVQDKPGDNPICFEDSKMILTVLESPIIESVTADSYSLCSEVNTMLRASVTNMAVTYSWNPSVGLNDANISNPVFSADVLSHESRSYTLTVKSKNPGNECISVANLKHAINIYPNPTVSLDAIESNLCSNGSNGEIKVDASGGTPKLAAPLYDFSWNPPALNSNKVTGLAPNLYTVTVIDSKLCEATLDVEVKVQPRPIGIFFE